MYRVFPLSQVKVNHNIVTKPFYYFLKVYEPNKKVPERPWFKDVYMDRYMYLMNGVHKVDLFCANTNQFHSFMLTPTKVYKNEKLYCEKPSLFMIPSGILYKEHVGVHGCVSTNIMKPNPNTNHQFQHSMYYSENNLQVHDMLEEMI